MEVNGLPLHVLLVHLVVVLLPLVSAAGAVAAVWPAAQRKLTFLIPLGALVGTAAVPLTTRAGESLAESLGSPPFIADHQNYGEMVLPWAVGLLLTTTAQYAYLRDRPRRGWPAIALSVAVVVAAIGTTVTVFLTGESGSRAVWGR